jgi:hypothetical protein
MNLNGPYAVLNIISGVILGGSIHILNTEETAIFTFEM